MSYDTLLSYQRKLVKEAIDKLEEYKQVGLDVFARGGKSYIAMELINYLSDKKGCNKFLVIAPKAITNNLRLNLFKSYNNITYIGKEMLSRNYSLEELIKASGEDPSEIDVIIFDEAHTMFGENIGIEINKAMDYIKSKYVIAMTATPVSNLKGINTLECLVRKDCILHYEFNEAAKNGDITPVKYIPAVLKYNSDCYDKLNELKNNIVCENAYVVKLYEQLEHQIRSLEGDLEDKLFNYIKDRICLNSSEGGRVFVFFGTIHEIEENREVITNVLERLYRYWGNKDIKVNFYNYTSKSPQEEEDAVLELIGREPYRNTIDVIATVNKGSMGIHPSKVHFGMIMCGTKSITKYMQLVGRITNLTYKNESDTIIFDFRNNRSFLGKVSINVGRQKLRDRREFKRNRALTMFNEESIEKAFEENVELMSCDQIENTADLLDRVENLLILTKDNEDLIEFIKKHLNTIDNDYYGNIAKYLADQANKHQNSNTSHSLTWYLKYLKMYERYNQVRKALLFDGFTEEDKETIGDLFDVFGYRIYIDKKDSLTDITYIKELYEDFMDIGNSKVKANKFVNKYYYDYLTDNMSSGCYAMIQTNEKVANKMLGKTNEMISDGSMDSKVSPTVINMCKKISNDLNMLNNLAKGETSCNKNVNSLYLEVSVIYSFIKSCYLEPTAAAYVDNIIRYLDKFYGDIISEANNRLHSKDEKPKVEKIVAIMDGYLNNYLDKLGSKNTSLDRTIAVISKEKNFNNVDEIYRIALRLIGIQSTSKFNQKIVPKTYMAKLVNDYLASKDRDYILALERFIQREDLPEQLNKKLGHYNNDKITYKNCTDRDLKIAVQSLLKENNKEHVDLLRNSIRKKRTTDEQVILNAFSRYATDRDIAEVTKFIDGQDFDKKSVVKAIKSYDCTLRLLLKLSTSGALHKAYENKVKEMITF